MRRYRRNGNPIGDHKVYVVMPGSSPVVWEIKGCKHWEEVPETVALEAMAGTFGPDFDADKSFIIMPGANLSGERLYSVDLSGADLSGADLSGANLRLANLMGVNLRDSNLIYANLVVAQLESADLRGADFFGTQLWGADLKGAKRLPEDPPIPGWRFVEGKLV